jgi:Flp pilus assembly protein CpaB
VRRVALLALALATALVVASVVRAGDEARRRWGTTTPVAVAVRDLAPGDAVTAGAVEVRDLPEAVVPSGALDEAPAGAIARQPVVAGEALVAERLAPHGLAGTAALVPAGQRAVAVPVGPTGAPPHVVGDQVDVLVVSPGLAGPPTGADRPTEAGPGPPAFALVERGLVVAADDTSASVAVPEPDAPDLAFAVSQGGVVLTLTGA